MNSGVALVSACMRHVFRLYVKGGKTVLYLFVNKWPVRLSTSF